MHDVCRMAAKGVRLLRFWREKEHSQAEHHLATLGSPRTRPHWTGRMGATGKEGTRDTDVGED